jgi:Na+/H+-dicarboxylate symporter
MTPTSSLSSFDRLLSILPTLRKPRNFFLYILPFSIVFGRLIPSSYASALNDAGLAMVQLIAFPAIPLVLSAVMISIANIFSPSNRTPSSRIQFSSRFIISLSLTIVLAALLAILLSIYQSPGVLSPDGKLSIGRFMLDITDIRIGTETVASQGSSEFWITKLVPSNILADASQGQTLRVITGSILAGFAMSKLRPSLIQPLLSLLRSVNSTSVQVLNIVLNLAPLVLICLIAGAVSTINAEIVVALLNFTICVFLTAIASLGISRLVFRRFTSTKERDFLDSNPVDSVFLLSLSTGSSMTSYPLMFETLIGIGRDESEVEASASLSLLIARLGNVTYNVIAIMFALNLYEVGITPIRFVEIILLGAFTGISAAGLTGVATVPTIGVALAYFQVPIPPVLVLLLAIDPILTLPRAATTGVLAMAISVISSSRSIASDSAEKTDSSLGLLSKDGEVPSFEGG